jgi:hypothetical protein
MPTYTCVINGTITIPDLPGSGQPPLGIWGGGNVPMPTPPIAPGGPGLGFWGGVAPPVVSHPIAPGGGGGGSSPPGYWGGVAPPLPTHPIAPGGGGGSPPGYWGGVAPPFPAHPIYLPIGEDGAQRKLEAKTAWTPQTGWVLVFVPTDEATLPTPSE